MELYQGAGMLCIQASFILGRDIEPFHIHWWHATSGIPVMFALNGQQWFLQFRQGQARTSTMSMPSEIDLIAVCKVHFIPSIWLNQHIQIISMKLHGASPWSLILSRCSFSCQR